MLKSFFVRLASSILILTLYVGMYILRNTVGINIIIALISAAAVYEFCQVTAKKNYESKVICPFAVIFAFLVPLTNKIIPLTLIFVLCIFTLMIVKFDRINIEKLFFAAFTASVITLSMSCITLLKNFDSVDYVMPLIYASAVTDVFCYLVGILFGRHKLSPAVSPNKSLEGAVGGVVFTSAIFVAYAFFANFFFKTAFNPLFAAVVGIVFAVAAQIGDLAESAIKRKYDIKDFSNLIPGHGGVYDRIDSWITTSPLVLLIAVLLK